MDLETSSRQDSVCQKVSDPQGRLIEATPADFDGLRDQWSELASQGRAAEPFYQPYWFRAFATTFNATRSCPTVVVRKNGKLVGILPLMRRRTFFGKVPGSVLRSLSGIHSCRYDFISEESEEEHISLAAWRALREDRSWSVIEALGVPEDGAFGNIMRHAANDGYLLAYWPTLLSPYLVIPERADDPFVNSPHRYRKDRKRLDKYHSRLSELGAIQLDVFDNDDKAIFEEFIAMEGAGWKGKRGGAIQCCPVTLSFYRELLPRAAARGHLRWCALRAGARRVAMEMSFTIGERCFSPKITYDEGVSRCAPGQLLARASIRELAMRGCRRYDLLGARARYKTLWAGTVRRHSNCYIFRPSVIGTAYRSALKDVAPLLRRARHRLYGDPQAES